ncbi:MAG: hypothetical protein AAF371_12990 [Pseudomonadota bacterium]
MSDAETALPSSLVLVLGMHRSGSSAVARVLSLLGHSLPKTLIPANLSNRRGHWESQPIARLNDAYMDAAELVWSDWTSGLLPRMRSAAMRDFEADLVAHVADEFPAGQPAVLKEPRVCRLVPRYRSAFERRLPMRAVIPIRNPLEVIASLVQRNALTKTNAGLLWLRYTLDAVLGSEGLPRAFVAYDKLLEKPEETLARVEDALGTPFAVPLSAAAADIEAFLNAGLRSHARTGEDVIHCDLTRGWISDAYAALRVLTEAPTAARPLDTLARIHREMTAAEPMLGYIVRSYDRELDDLKRRVASLSASVELKVAQVRMLRETLEGGTAGAVSADPAGATATSKPGAD